MSAAAVVVALVAMASLAGCSAKPAAAPTTTTSRPWCMVAPVAVIGFPAWPC